MRIVQINSVCGSGSTGKIAVDIAKNAETAGYESIIAYGRNDAQNYTNTIQIGSKNGVRYHGVMSRLTDKHGLFSEKATKVFVKQLQEIKPDIIHLHNIHGYYLHYPTLFQYIKQENIPVIWTLHDCWSFTGHCAYYTYANCSKYQTGCGNCPQRHEYPKSFVDNSASNFKRKKHWFSGVKNLTIVTPSKWLKEEVQKSFLSEYPVKVIHNGIDIEKFKQVEVQQDAAKKIILGVANVWDRRKGLDTFLQLSNILPDEYEIVLVGLTAEQIKILPSNITGIEKTESIEELVAYYNKAVVFLNPTQEDNYPTTNLEAQACGTPVITFDVGGTKETLKSAQSVVLNSKCSTIELFRTIQMCENHHVNVDSKLLSKETSNDEYLLLYKTVLRNNLKRCYK